MKYAMNGHVEQQRTIMFSQATESVSARLRDMCTDLTCILKMYICGMMSSTRRDYVAALIGSEESKIKGLPRAERLLRKEILSILLDADRLFGELVNQSGTDCVANLPEAHRPCSTTTATKLNNNDDDTLIAHQPSPNPNGPGTRIPMLSCTS